MAQRTTRGAADVVLVIAGAVAALVAFGGELATAENCWKSSECDSTEACLAKKCRDPCPGVCGAGAGCTVRNHIPVCSCPAGSQGDPFIECTADNKCKTSSECKDSELCLGGKCKDSCALIPCGSGAACIIKDHFPTCKCLDGFKGDPVEGCEPDNKCSASSDCGPSEACVSGECRDPCVGVCGTGATCTVRKHFPACSCPPGSTGDPFVSCNIENRTPADTPSTSTPAPTVDYLPALHRRCLRCLCEASTTCNLDFGCQEGYCGPFGVSHAYWNEAGRPVHPNADPQSDKAFEDCAKEYDCGSRIVKAYVNKLKKDCNGDGLVNCDDFAMMHHNGGYSCQLPLNRTEGGRIYRRRYLKCKGDDQDDDPLGQSVAATF